MIVSNTNDPMNDPIKHVRDSVRSIHQQFEENLRRGDPKATAMFRMLGREMNAARTSLRMSPLSNGPCDCCHQHQR